MDIHVVFEGGLSESQKSTFETAAKRWEQIITSSRTVTIHAKGESIDGVGRILGRAGPTLIGNQTGLPLEGIMEFDTDDLDDMERNGSLENVIIHEMGHVLGIGTIWEDKRLLRNPVASGGTNPRFLGRKAMREYTLLVGSNRLLSVPVENEGGRGTADGHWRERIFDDELMTGILDPGMNPLSRLTLASLEDLGYTVNYAMAESYILPSMRVIALRDALSEDELKKQHRCFLSHKIEKKYTDEESKTKG